MTTTRINHRDCIHPRTTAARQICRKQQLEWLAAMGRDVVISGPSDRPITAPTRITEPHCEMCGSTDYENTMYGDQGYSACCNEPVVSVSCHGCSHK
jgi:hypothetical protein